MLATFALWNLIAVAVLLEIFYIIPSLTLDLDLPGRASKYALSLEVLRAIRSINLTLYFTYLYKIIDKEGSTTEDILRITSKNIHDVSQTLEIHYGKSVADAFSMFFILICTCVPLYCLDISGNAKYAIALSVFMFNILLKILNVHERNKFTGNQFFSLLFDIHTKDFSFKLINRIMKKSINLNIISAAEDANMIIYKIQMEISQTDNDVIEVSKEFEVEANVLSKAPRETAYNSLLEILTPFISFMYFLYDTKQISKDVYVETLSSAPIYTFLSFNRLYRVSKIIKYVTLLFFIFNICGIVFTLL